MGTGPDEGAGVCEGMPADADGAAEDVGPVEGTEADAMAMKEGTGLLTATGLVSGEATTPLRNASAASPPAAA